MTSQQAAIIIGKINTTHPDRYEIVWRQTGEQYGDPHRAGVALLVRDPHQGGFVKVTDPQWDVTELPALLARSRLEYLQF